MYYGIIYIIILLFAVYTFNYPKTKYFEKMKIVIFIILVFTSGLRFETAVDFYAYVRKFESMETINNLFNYNLSGFFIAYPGEVGFTILNSLVKSLVDNVQVLFFIISLFTTTLLFKSLSLYIPRKTFFLSLLLYYVFIFFILDMSGIRQGIALNIVFYAISKLEKSDVLKFMICVFIASLFHISAALFLLAPIFLNINPNKKMLLAFIIIGLVVFIFRIRWINPVIDAIYSIFSENYFVARLYNYTTSTAVYAKERPIFIMLFVNLLLYLFSLRVKDKYLVDNRMNNIFFNMFSLFMLSTLFLWEISDFGVRFGLYFSLGLVYCLPQMTSFFTEKSRPFVLIFLLLYAFIHIRVYVIEDRSVITYNPYQNYLIHEVFDLKSTGPERLAIYLDELDN